MSNAAAGLTRDSVEGIVWAIPAGGEGAPIEGQGARRDNRLFLSRANWVSRANWLDKIRNIHYCISLNGTSFRSAPAGREEKFSYFSAYNPLKNLDSENKR
jgi:hypothetical protein